jgi:hypothetical protein
VGCTSIHLTERGLVSYNAQKNAIVAQQSPPINPTLAPTNPWYNTSKYVFIPETKDLTKFDQPIKPNTNIIKGLLTKKFLKDQSAYQSDNSYDSDTEEDVTKIIEYLNNDIDSCSDTYEESIFRV